MQYLIKSTAFFVLLFVGTNGFSQSKDSTSAPVSVQKPLDFDKLIETYQQELEERGGIEGYRVQIYNGKKSACLAKRSEFLTSYPEVTIQMIYESPEYRIQVGDFRTKIEADKFLKEISKQFTGSFTVKTIILLPKL